MKIGLISDTHIEGPEEHLPPLVFEAFVGCDLILHAGDLAHLCILDELEAIAPVLAARGYRDPSDHRVAEVRRLSLDGLAVGLLHDIAHPAYGIRAVGTEAHLQFPPEPLPQLMARRCKGPVDLVVFGDTHLPTIVQREGIVLVNPGSPTYPHGPKVGTVGLLEISLRGLRVSIHLLESGLPLLKQEERPWPV